MVNEIKVLIPLVESKRLNYTGPTQLVEILNQNIQIGTKGQIKKQYQIGQIKKIPITKATRDVRPYRVNCNIWIIIDSLIGWRNKFLFKLVESKKLNYTGPIKLEKANRVKQNIQIIPRIKIETQSNPNFSAWLC